MKLSITRIAILALLTFAASSVVVVVDSGEAQAQKRKKGKVKKLRAMGGIKGGLIVSGEVESGFEVDGEAVAGSSGVTLQDESSFGINAYAAWPVAKTVRVGPSIWAFPSVEYKQENQTTSTNEDSSFGLEANLIAEYVMPLGKFDGFGYVEGGLSMIMPPEPKEETAVKEENMIGYNVGGGLGGQFLVSKSLAARADLRGSFYSVSSDTDVNGETRSLTLEGTRFMLNVGIAFGL